MPERLRILGQVDIAVADTEEQLYKCPEGFQVSFSSIVVCNRDSTDRTFRVAVDRGDGNAGASDDMDYLYFDTPVPANETYVITIGIVAGPGDSLNVRGSHADMTFSAFGAEVSL